MMEREKKLVSLCLLILCVANVVIYLLLYQVRGNELKINEIGQSTSGHQEENKKSDQDFVSLSETEFTGSELDQGVNNSNISAGNDAISSGDIVKQTASTGLQGQAQGAMYELSGAQPYFGVVDAFEVLGVEPEYILKDAKGRYYAYFEQEPINLRKTVQQLGGNIYSLKSEADLIKNELFGERVDFINLPEYKDKLVLMLVWVNDQKRLIQIPFQYYYQSKSYLKSLFN